MNASNTTELMHTLGQQAKAASALMAKASAATKLKALRGLAALLRANVALLQVENAKDLDRARAAGLAEPMVDRLKLTPKVIETCAEGCEQLAAMADIIGEVSGMKQMPSGIRVGQMRVPLGVFGMWIGMLLILVFSVELRWLSAFGRGDVVTLTAMDFLENQLLEESATGPGFMEILSRNLGGIINSLAFVAVAFLIVWMGIRPMIRTAGGGGADTALAGGIGEQAAGLELPDFSPALGGGSSGGLMDGFGSDFGFDSTDDLLTMDDDPNGGFNRRVKEGPERRLSRMVEISEERAAKILRKWAVDNAA